MYVKPPSSRGRGTVITVEGCLKHRNNAVSLSRSATAPFRQGSLAWVPVPYGFVKSNTPVEDGLPDVPF